jgi:hypothetical protein
MNDYHLKPSGQSLLVAGEIPISLVGSLVLLKSQQQIEIPT